MNQPTSISWNVTGGFCWRCSDGRPKNWMHQRQSHPLHNGFNRPQKNFHLANRANKPNFCRKIQGMLVRSHFFVAGKTQLGSLMDRSTGRPWQISLNEDLPSHSRPGTGFLCGFFPVFLPGTPKPTVFKWMFGWLNNPFPM